MGMLEWVNNEIDIAGYWDSRSGEFVTIDEAFELKEEVE